MAASGLVLWCSLPGAFAAEAGSDIEQLRQQIAAQQLQLELQQAQFEAQKAQLELQKAQLDRLEQSRLATQDAPRWTMAYGRPTITSADGRSTLFLRGLVQGDYAHHAQDAAAALTTDFRRGSVGAVPNRENNAARDLSDGLYFRRARLGVEGAFNRNFNYRLVLEVGGSGTEGPTRINDAWINYVGFAPFTIQFGAGAPPANLDDGTAPEDGLFLERASPADLSRSLGGADGRTGIGIRGSGARWMGALTFTGRTVNDAEVFDSQNALVARAAGLVATGADYNLHVGASVTYVLRPADAGIDAAGVRYGIRFRNQPELRVDSTRLIDTGGIDAEHASATGVEFAGNWRNLLVQGEHFWFGVKRRSSPLANPAFSGFYLQGSWVLTGESHRYNMASASYQNPRPFIHAGSQSGWGAWEFALRYSHTDLDFHTGLPGAAAPAEGVRGGVQNIWTVGLNWYLNPNLKLMLNGMRIDVDRLNPSLTAFGAAPNSPPLGAQVGQQFSSYALRGQFSL
jgi:phosphate-selective porin OprO/OprP